MLRIYTYSVSDDGECENYTKESGKLIDKKRGFFSDTFIIQLDDGEIVERHQSYCYYSEEKRDNYISEVIAEDYYWTW